MKLPIIVLCLFVFPLVSQALVSSEAEFIRLTIEDRAKGANLPPERLLAIAWCESAYRLDALNINKNGTKDVSIFQINDVHLPTLKALGLNRWNYSDNIDYAIMLIKRNGYRDWNSSRTCWLNKELALNGG